MKNNGAAGRIRLGPKRLVYVLCSGPAWMLSSDHDIILNIQERVRILLRLCIQKNNGAAGRIRLGPKLLVNVLCSGPAWMLSFDHDIILNIQERVRILLQLGIQKNNGAAGRIRTDDLTVNSRTL